MPAPPVIPGQLGTELAVKSTQDVLDVLPAEMRRAETAPVRDAISAALVELLLEAQQAASYAADQANAHRATDQYQDGLGEDRGLHRAPDETNAQYRDRIFEVPEVVTHDAIRGAVNAILAPWTSVQCQVFDAVLDRLFIRSNGATSAAWHSHIAKTATRVGPNYPIRFFEGDSPNNGGNSLPGNDPGGARLFKDQVGRMFVVLVPDLSPLNSTPAFLYVSPPPLIVALKAASFGKKPGFYVGTGVSSKNTTYVSKGTKVALDVYAAIVSKVNEIAGQSVRWALYADPKLK